MSENTRDPEITTLEAALAELAPRPAAINRDRLMFEAGRRAAQRHSWLAPGIAAVLASAVTMAVALLGYHPEPRVVQVQVPAAPVQGFSQFQEALIIDDARWERRAEALRLRNDIIERGLDALPPPTIDDGPSPPINLDNLMQ